MSFLYEKRDCHQCGEKVIFNDGYFFRGIIHCSNKCRMKTIREKIEEDKSGK